MGRGLGSTQLAVLRTMSQRNGGVWSAGCGWVWNTWSGTTKLMEALHRRGLVDKKLVHREGWAWQAPRDVTVYTINDAGRAAATS